MATMKRKAFTTEQDRVLLAVAKRPHANGQALYEAYIAESGDTVHGLGATATRLHGILSWSHEAMDPALKIDLVRRARVEYARRTGRANGQAGTDVVVDGREWITAGAAAAILGVHPRSVNNLDIDRRGGIHPLHRNQTRMMYARDGVVALAERRRSETREDVATGELPGLSAGSTSPAPEPAAPVAQPTHPAPTRSLAERLDVLNLALAAGDLTFEEHRAKVRAAVGA